MRTRINRFVSRAALLLALALPGIALLPGSAAAQNAPASGAVNRVLSGFRSGRAIGEVAVSPDGKRVAWTQSGPGGMEIRVAPSARLSDSRRISAADNGQSCAEDSLAWAPDSQTLAFFSDCARPNVQDDLYLSRVDGGPARRLTHLQGYVQMPAFSPDGSRIAFLYVPGASRPAGGLAAQTPPAGVIGEDGLEIQRVAYVPAAGHGQAEPVFATPENLHVYEVDWSPDAKALAYVAADPPGENNWWMARLYTQALGDAPRVVLNPATVAGPLHGLQIAVPRWRPDGKAIALIGGLMSDQGVTGGDLWLVSAEGGTPQNLTPGRPATEMWFAWEGQDRIDAVELAGSDCRLTRFNVQQTSASVDGAPVALPGSVDAGALMSSLSGTSNHSMYVFKASNFEKAPEIYALRIKEEARVQQLSNINDDVKPGWGKPVSMEWTNDGFHVQGWLLLPLHYNPAKKYPLIVEVHGGPAWAVMPDWEPDSTLSPAVFSALGYFVLQPNPRGSFGEGEAFMQANRKDFGYGDLRDILAGVDAVEAKYSIDPQRVGLTGWSYGGFMSMFAVTQTHRFRAAVAGAGISDWLSYYGENSIDQWMIPYFGASVYDDPAVYARSSAINFIKQVRTPTLVVVGDRDGECPAPQSFEFWHALRDQHVPTQLVVYPNEGHGFSSPEHRHDVVQRAVEWFARYMPPAS